MHIKEKFTHFSLHPINRSISSTIITINPTGGKINKNNLNSKDSEIFSAKTNVKPSRNVLIKERQVKINKIE